MNEIDCNPSEIEGEQSMREKIHCKHWQMGRAVVRLAYQEGWGFKSYQAVTVGPLT